MPKPLFPLQHVNMTFPIFPSVCCWTSLPSILTALILPTSLTPSFLPSNLHSWHLSFFLSPRMLFPPPLVPLWQSSLKTCSPPPPYPCNRARYSPDSCSDLKLCILWPLATFTTGVTCENVHVHTFHTIPRGCMRKWLYRGSFKLNAYD